MDKKRKIPSIRRQIKLEFKIMQRKQGRKNNSVYNLDYIDLHSNDKNPEDFKPMEEILFYSGEEDD